MRQGGFCNICYERQLSKERVISIQTHVASRLTCRRAFVPYALYVPSCLSCLHVLRVLCAVLRVLFAHLEIFCNGFLVQQKLSIFQGLLKKSCCFYVDQKKVVKPFKQTNLLSTEKREINSIFLWFSFQLFSNQVITSPVLK